MVSVGFAMVLGLSAGTAGAQSPNPAPLDLTQPAAQPQTAIAEFGAPLYKDLGQPNGPDHFPYADPAAKKGGSIVLGAYGTFDSLNGYILRGDLPAGLGMIDDTLMTGSGDELAVGYGLIAESVEIAPDKSSATFTLNPKATWQDNTPITAEDFKAALEAIQAHGKPFLQAFFADVSGVAVLDPHTIKFSFKTRESMKPIITVATGLSPLPRQFWAKHDITKTLLEPVLGSGAYRIAAVDPGKSITYERVKDYWAADLPVLKGQENIDTIRYDYYGDDNVMFEAFKAHKIDFRQENKAARWVGQYNIDAVNDHRIIKRAVHEDIPQGVQGLFFNLRRPQFQDVRVREALNDLFDFETLQRTLLNGQYKRDKSYFPGSDYGASGMPTPAELAILLPFKDKLPPRLFTQAFEPPKTDGSGNIRQNMHLALDLFKQAGWEVKDNKLQKDGQPFKLEVLLDNDSFVRVVQPYIDNLKRAGIDASIRLIDTAQYQVRLDDYDFDAIQLKSNFFPPPGAELRSYYGSAAAGTKGEGNWAGIKDPVVDALIEQIVAAKDLETLKATNRALDRVLLWQFYCVPQWYNDEAWLAYWDRFAYPAQSPKYGTGFPDTWWVRN
jgi:microcin C transport system substrate-binding protein